jgi:predicted nicotinamide N-methyase
MVDAALLRELHFERLSRRAASIEIAAEGLPEVYVRPGASLGGHTWGAAIAMSHLLIREPWRVAGKDVIELGSGTGLVGVTCAVVKAKSVLLSDLAINICLLQQTCGHHSSFNIQCLELDWFDISSLCFFH